MDHLKLMLTIYLYGQIYITLGVCYVLVVSMFADVQIRLYKQMAPKIFEYAQNLSVYEFHVCPTVSNIQ